MENVGGVLSLHMREQGKGWSRVDLATATVVGVWIHRRIFHRLVLSVMGTEPQKEEGFDRNRMILEIGPS